MDQFSNDQQDSAVKRSLILLILMGLARYLINLLIDKKVYLSTKDIAVISTVGVFF
jgi:hypothetical protein